MTAVFISGFEYDTDDATVRKHFSPCGAIEDLYFQSKGSAVVTYAKESAATKALELDGSTMKGQTRYVSVKLDDPDRSGEGKGKSKGKGGGSGSSIYVSGFDYETDESALMKHFSSVGRIKELFFQSNGSAVITYNGADSASRAVDELNETTMKGQSRYVAVKMDDRPSKGKGKGKGSKGGSSSGRTVFVNGFEYDTDDAAVRKHFGACGAIEDLYFQSKGSAVVTYTKESAAARAVELDGSTMKGQTRYVSVKLDDPDRSKGKGKGKYW